MSYVVLARRYRPQTFEELVGQEPIVTTIKNAILSDRVAHAYLLTGPRGVGKTSTARILSKALNCKQGPTDSPCNTCDICRCISEGNDIDVLEIDGASNRGIDEVRNIRQNVGYAPSRARYKIYIIDEVHMLTREAFNALLKTLEEPPSHVKFIFATTAVNRLPETVQSRCQRFDFKNISSLDIQKQLSKICRAEGVQFDQHALQLIARYAKGGLRDSQSVLDQLLSFCKEKITLKDVNYVLGYIDEDKMLDMLESFSKKDASSALKIVEDVLNEGKTPVEFIDQLISYMRELMIFSSCDRKADWLEYNTNLIERFGKAFSGDTLMYMIQILSDTRIRTTDSLLQRILLEAAVIKLSRMESVGSLIEIMEKVLFLEKKLRQTDQITLEKNSRNQNVLTQEGDDALGKMYSKNEDIPFQKEEDVAFIRQSVEQPGIDTQKKIECGRICDNEQNLRITDSQKDVWEKMLDLIKRKKKSTWALLREGRLTGFNNGEITIEFPRNCSFHRERLDTIEEKKFIEQFAKNVVKSDIRIKFILSENGNKKMQNERQSDTKNISEQQVAAEEYSVPVVKKTIELFDAHVIKVTK
ncbi:MAG: DNA polymerase III subunit gamma/tau [Candidatus Brocadiaceae bacterium]|nr:DNA polymerase III subunit gamma/tau [Candidatus Brocadiaceae bacterium]